MAKLGSNVAAVVARLLKWVMLAVVWPLGIGILMSLLKQLERDSSELMTIRGWMTRGLLGYAGIHLFLYRPVALFRASHHLFSLLALWLFGGQVASVEQRGESRSAKKSKKPSGSSQGSALVAVSPYVIPLAVVLVCAVGWMFGRWMDPELLTGPLSVLIGAAAGFHWLMSAEALQQQRAQWTIETYLLALGLVFVLTLLIGSACLPWAISDFSFTEMLAGGLSQAQVIYRDMLHGVFF